MLRAALRSLLLCLLAAPAGLPLGIASAAEPAKLVIVAQAQSSYLNPLDGRQHRSDSNAVEAQAPQADPALRFFGDASYAEQIWVTRMGAAMFPQIAASRCNADPLRRDTLSVRLAGARSGYAADYTALETAPNSGLFELQSQVASRGWSASVPASPAYIDVLAGDVITATAADCQGVVLSAELRLDPRAFVFDSSTGQPVAGAQVQIVDMNGSSNGGQAGAEAAVFAADGTTPMPATVLSDAQGGYSFPVLREGVYRIVVRPPAGHIHPSANEGDRERGWSRSFPVHAAASYGGSFRVETLTDNAVVNVPLDPLPRGLMVQSRASRSIAEVAETLEYSIQLKNVGQADLANARLQTSLPPGFRYVPGSAQLDGKPAADPAGGVGPRLHFPVAASLPAAAEHTLRYRVRIGSGALQGDGLHRSQASAEAPEAVSSTVAVTRVKVEAGVFSDRAIVIGSVYADCNANGVQDEHERGVPGVRVWLEDGSSATTDGAGRFSLYGLTPRTHVLKLDAITLPAGTAPQAVSQRHAGDGRSRFVDPRAGELQRADFALAGCGAALDAQIDARRKAARGGDAEVSSSLKTALTAGAALASQDLRALPASGQIGATPRAQPEQAVSQAAPAATAASAAASAAVADTSTELPRFIGLQDGQRIGARDSTLRVAGHLGATLTLTLNGEPVGEDRIGERTQSPGEQSELRSYVGLPLRAGENLLVLREHDAFGQLRATRELRLRRAGALARIVIEAPERAAAGEQVAVRLRLEDAQGLPVDARLPLTLNLGPGRWSVPDLDPRTPELQTFVDGGEAQLHWQAPEVPGEARLRVSGDGVSAEARVALVAALRPMMAAGLIDAAIDLRRLKASQVQAADGSDGFDRQLRAFAGDGTKTEARGAVFLKGKVRGDALLTLAYDSAKGRDERLFRDIQPDAFYPIYGDASEKGFDAQSTSKLYVRLDRGQSSLLLGDFTTQAGEDTNRQLGSYQRSLNGIKQHLQFEGFSANAFAARDNTRQMIVELRANGTSGPFVLGPGIAENSEKVEVLVRDRHQPALVLRASPLARFTDYEIDPITGRLLFRAPVPSFDADLNPMSIRVSYEVEQGGPAFWVAGADARWQATEALQLGGSVVRDWNPLAPMQMGSVNARYQVAERTAVSAEVARVQRGDTADGTAARSGDAQRFEFTHEAKSLKARVHAARSDVGFDNRSALINSGRSEAGAQASYSLDERTRLVGEFLYSQDLASRTQRAGVLVGVERRLEGGAKLEFGGRFVQQLGGTSDPAQPALDTRTATVRAKASMAVPGLPLASMFIEAEQDVRDHDKRLLAVGGDVQIGGRGRAYLRHELISSLTGPYALDATQRRNTTLLGLDMGTNALGGGEGRIFSEYRGREAFSGRETEAAIGLRNQWQLTEGLRLNASLERLQALEKAEGKTDAQSAALALGVDYTASPSWKATGRLEVREGAGSTGLLSTLGLAVKLDERWSLLGKNMLSSTRAHGAGPDRWLERLQVGAAYRSREINALGRYEFKDERGSLSDAQARRAHVISVHAERQLDRATEITGRYAAKHLTETVAGSTQRTLAQLIGGRVTRDIGERWDVGVNAAVMGDARLRNRQTAFGAEVGYRVKDNMWASLGYNISGFKDRELSADNATQRGIYLRLRFKFDEQLFSRQ